jgi:hypothetical protein
MVEHLVAASVKNASLSSKEQLIQALINFENLYNKKATPFEWIKTAALPTNLRKKIYCANLIN